MYLHNKNVFAFGPVLKCLALFTWSTVAEGQYIKAVLGWRRKCNKRGLFEFQQCGTIKNYILDELMPKLP